MENIRKIMVAIAFSNYSEGIFTYAANLAATLNAELIVANVINSRDVDAVGSIVSMGYEVDGDHYIKGIRDERKKSLEKIMADAPLPAEKIRTVFKVGNPIEELLKLIIREEIDMIVMGPKGRTDLEHIIVGAVAEKMFRRSPATVVSYRDENHSKRLKKRIRLK
ncbi:MAG: hypothetical protein B6245_20675 [Desulfobacteraceae bacterium 4572_88]|nr:MAG: hypothetical protein B6245_20675 [Desulfobacteraceae bacterium 4572_88]